MRTGNFEELLFIEDTTSGWCLLVDSGAQQSALHALAADHLFNSRNLPLHAANGTPFAPYAPGMLLCVSMDVSLAGTLF